MVIGINSFVTMFLMGCAIIGLFAGAVGLLYAGIALLIRGLLNLEGNIRTAKVWRVALREYLEKRSLKL